MEQASAALVQRKYFESEELCIEALFKAASIGDFDRIALGSHGGGQSGAVGEHPALTVPVPRDDVCALSDSLAQRLSKFDHHLSEDALSHVVRYADFGPVASARQIC